MSCLLHGTVLVVLAYSLRFAPRGAATEPDRSAGIVLVRQNEGRREYFSDDSPSPKQTQAASNLAQSHYSILPAEDEEPVDLSGVLPSTDASLGVGGETGLPSAGELLHGDRRPVSMGEATQTEVFGVAGTGTMFVYVFDRSGSMDGFGGRPLAAAKAELLASLDDLDRTHQFQIIFYNEMPRVFHPDRSGPRLVWADDANKALARRFVRGINAEGSTRHARALQLALGMRPDVIFFLTDADEPQLSVEELASIRRANHGTVINAIEFGFGPQTSRDNFLVRLAGQNGGSHAYVDVGLLKQN